MQRSAKITWPEIAITDSPVALSLARVRVSRQIIVGDIALFSGLKVMMSSSWIRAPQIGATQSIRIACKHDSSKKF